jgi:dihydroorotase
MTSTPAAILGINAGILGVDARADICVFNREDNWQLDENQLHSQGKNSPFIGWNFQSKVKHTIIGGTLIHSS